MKNVRRFVETAAHLSLRQMAVRAAVVARRRWWRTIGAMTKQCEGAKLRPDAKGLLPINMEAIASLPEHAREVNRTLAGAEAIIRGEYTFLGKTQGFSQEIDWHSPGMSQLWRYHLQYFGWVPSLVISDAVTGVSAGFRTFCRQVDSWHIGNAALRGDGWHPYTLSLRTVNWLKACAGWSSEMERNTDVRDGVAASLHAQVLRLEQQLEFDVRGNHLLENARALCWAGVFFEGLNAARWLRRSDEILATEIPEQVLPDGAHFERTPGYHTTMLSLFSELALLRLRNGLAVPDEWIEAIQRMAAFLRAILAPDGRLPLLKDTTYDAMACPADLLHIAARITGDDTLAPPTMPGLWPQLLTTGLPPFDRRKSVLLTSTPNPTQSGFFVANGQSGSFLVADCGRPCPDYLPAHAHADALSFEFHFAGEPLVVDSGVYEYTRGQWRDFFRSTRAHNTVEVDGENSSDVWSSFRVGRRARVQVRGYGLLADSGWLTAEHNGYCHLRQKVTHRRCFYWRDGEFLLVFDSLRGSGTATLRSHIHLHPAAEIIDALEDVVHLRLEADVYLRSINTDHIKIVRGVSEPTLQGWYSEKFGARVANNVVCLNKVTMLPCLFGYIISPDPAMQASCREHDGGAIVTISRNGAERKFLWSIDKGTISL